MPAAPAPAAQAMQAHSKAYKAIAWPKLWPAPAQGRGPAHSQGQTREHCNGRGSNQRPRAQPAAAQQLSLAKRESLVEGVTSPHRQQCSFLLSMPISGVTSGTELGAVLWNGGQKGTGSVPGCQAQCWGADQEASPTSQRADPLLLWWEHSGRGLPCPPLQRLCRISHFCLQLSARNTPVLGCS